MTARGLSAQVDHVVFFQPRKGIVGIAEAAGRARAASAGIRPIAELGPGSVTVMRADKTGGVTNGTAIGPQNMSLANGERLGNWTKVQLRETSASLDDAPGDFSGDC